MFTRLKIVSLCFSFVGCSIGLGFPEHASAQSSRAARPAITQEIDESKLVTLTGNTRPEANPGNDRGAVFAETQFEHMLLQLKRTTEQERALQLFVDNLQNPSSPDFHHWLTAAEFGDRFGIAQQDVEIITRWLTSHGFQVNQIYPNRVLIDFSGTAGQVMHAFHTEIHQLEVNGVRHIANLREPMIPSALADAIAGIVSLHDFRPRPMMKLRHQYTISSALSGNQFAVVPGDLATIYNFNPVFNAGVSGQGQTIALIENTNLYSAADWTTFRSTFGLSGYSAGSLTQTNPAPPS